MNQSYWIKSVPESEYPTLHSNIQVDIAIIGAGITGLTTAYYVSNATTNVAILEADHIGYGASGRSTGKVTSQHGLCYHQLSELHGHDFTKAYYQANEEAIDSVEEIAKSHQLDCNFQRLDSIVYTDDSQKIMAIQDEYQTCLDIGIDCEYIISSEYPIPLKAGIRFHNQAQFHPQKYLIGLASIVYKTGISIYEHSPVTNMEKKEQGYVLFVGEHHVTAKQVVFATQFPFLDRSQLYFTKIINDQSELMMSSYDKHLPNEQLISCDEKLDSYRTYSDGNETYLIAGGHKHPVGRSSQEYLEDFYMRNRSRFHIGKHFQHWSSQDYITADLLPLIGPLTKHDHNVLFASGFQKWGNTFGTIAGKLLCAVLLHEESPYQSMFHPHRASLVMSSTFIKDNWETMKALIKSKLSSGSFELPEADCGLPMEIDGHMYGVFVEKNENIHILDITCPHLGCTCVFNQTDKTWDCPCHGSRFDIDGNIIKGPATAGLHPYGEGKNHINPHIIK